MSTHCISPVQKKYFSLKWDQALLHRALFRITRPVAHDIISRWEQLVSRHGILRTVSTYTNNVSIPFQEVEEEDQTTLTVIADTSNDEKAVIGEWQRIAAPENGEIRLVIFNDEEGGPAYLGIIAPTVWLDSWSLRYLVQQLVTADAPEEEPLQFIQYVEWLESALEENPELSSDLEQEPIQSGGTLTLQEGKDNPVYTSYITTNLQAGEILLEQLEQVAAEKGVTPADIWYWAWTNVTSLYLKQGTGAAVYISSGRQFDEFKQIPGPFAKGIYGNFRKEDMQDLVKLKGKRERFDLYREQFNADTANNSCTCSFEYLERDHFPGGVLVEMPVCVDSLSCHEPFILSFFAEDTASTTRIVLQADKNAIAPASLEWIRQTLLDYVSRFISGEIIVSRADIQPLFGAEIPFDFVPVTDTFMATAGRYPDHIALEWNGGSMSYRDLLQQSRQVAEVLIVQHGIQPGDRILINMDRTEKLLPVIWGVMLSGATYIPADKQYPAARIQYIMQQSEARLAITDDAETDNSISPEELFQQAALIEVRRQLPRWQPDQPVYILYTSGTTGQPKGCIITMSNLLHYTRWAGNYYFSNHPSGTMPLFTPIAFDLTVTTVFCTLLRGAILYICEEDADVSVHLRNAFSTMNAIKLTPSHIRMLPHLDIKHTAVDTCIVGGEALQESDIAILRALHPGMKIYNEYGPTECTVGCIVWDVPASFNDILIGKPISNTSVSILDTQMEPCTPGIEGEIWIGGSTVGAGYFHDEAKTAARFVNGLYKTGDKGYWLPDGNICYTGRNDDMIKLRGHRIERGEITALIRSVTGVQDAFVIIRQEELVAYYVGAPELAAAIRKEMVLQLPVYMHPACLIALDRFPINANGKLDIAALPSPEEVRNRQEVVLPNTPQEKLLAQVWEAVLQKTPVGIHDHFLGIGGDSIKAIQVVAKMREKGWMLQVGDILRFPTISQLVNYLKEADNIPADELTAGGTIPLTPLQIKFFRDNTADLHYYNQSVLLQAAGKIAVDDLKTAVNRLWQYHAALRTNFPLSGNERIQQVLPAAVTLDGIFVEQEAYDLKGQTKYWQQQFDLETGPLFRCILFHGEEADYVFLLAHHLIVDGVSWRIILEQLSGNEGQREHAYGSYLRWSQALRKKADSLTVQEMSYWMEMEATVADDWTDLAPVQKTYQHFDHLHEALSAASTRHLLSLPLHKMNVTIQELQLAALTSAIYKWSGRSVVTLYLESHGRNSTEDAASFAETVGWFTMKYPIVLPCLPAEHMYSGIQQTIAALEKVPGNGEGYLCQRYLGELPGNNQGLEPLITFNYLGQHDTGDAQLFTIHPLSPLQQNVGPAIYMPSALYFTLIISEGALQVSLSYHRSLFTKEATTQLLGKYIACLEQFIDALGKGDGMFKKKVSGTAALGLNEQELEEIYNSL
ncbi:non-ribosomal peptide synthetase [Chitinophaga ginsengisoli]|uniref:Non-ribosomal peptide synthase protein (TIGR01720 family)/amino acid adenylation domain-containing protein n=1 Tax=Chitinophaga ginsengisoli TaxID=363837 RepID=A0A2P8FQP7_9BACT|nr:non-ribosomal peptide synthetase [Chitinophaga ginsengisoli]PSL24056.1 non-ribosomal peptide synthase protein (TIGR01720 family)/amino acid adenylation domain-containing protein [Chitinophaga ginsengisoli]